MLPSLSYEEKVTFFFCREPLRQPTGDFHSTLGLIRNDIATLSQCGPNSLAFPRAMCLMVAIDLLGKMRAGSDSIGGVGDRFRGFVEFALDPATYGSDIGRRIYEFRNALHHSYRMYTDWKPDGRGGHTASWQLALIDAPKITWLTQDEANSTIINLARLHEGIEGGIQRFQQSLETATDRTARESFENMFNKHGWMPTSTQRLS
jgi:hypothetical protein